MATRHRKKSNSVRIKNCIFFPIFCPAMHRTSLVLQGCFDVMLHRNNFVMSFTTAARHSSSSQMQPYFPMGCRKRRVLAEKFTYVMHRTLRMIHRAIFILINHFVRDISICFHSVCTSPAKEPFQSPRVDDLTMGERNQCDYSVIKMYHT